jgi:hypothetical protein
VASPCSSLITAINAVSEGGSIRCIGTGKYYLSGAIIDKKLTIDRPGNSFQGGSNGNLAINGANIIVRVRNLSMKGFAAVGAGNGSALHVENVDISGFGNNPAAGIKFAPATAAKLFVSNSSISENGNGAVGGGIVISPSGSGSARVVIDRTTITNNVFGIAVDGSADRRDGHKYKIRQ